MSILHSRIEGRYRTLGVLFIGLWFAAAAHGQVQPMPIIPNTFLDVNGKPLAGGCLATFVSGTSTPLQTFSDAAGTVPNSDPVQLTSAGTAIVFLQAQAYTIKLYAHGATNNCSTSLGPLQYSIDGIAPSANSILASNNVWSGSNIFNGSLTTNSTTTFNAGYTSNGPSIMAAGGSMAGTFSGTPTFSGMPIFSNGFTVNSSTATFNGPIILNGNPAMGVLFTTQIPNLNASFLEGATWEAPLDIGTTTPMDGTFAGLHATTNFQIASGALIGGTKGTDTTLLTAGTVSGTGNTLCVDANGGATTNGCSTSGFSQIEAAVISSPCTPGSSSSFDACNSTVTWPVAFADTSYVVTCTGLGTGYNTGTAGSNNANLIYIRSKSTGSASITIQNGRGAADAPTEVDCTAIHP